MLIRIGPLGPRQGRDFEDIPSGALQELYVWHSSAGVHKILTVYSDGGSFSHGLDSPACACSSVILSPGETLMYVHGCLANAVCCLSFRTSLQRNYGPFGSSSCSPFGFCGPVLSFVGRCDHMIRTIGAMSTV